MKFFLIALILVSCASNSKKKEEKISHIYFKQGTAELVQKKYTSALTNLLKAVEISPHNSEIHNNLGMAYYFKKRPQKALFHLNKSLKIDPKNISAKANMATVYMNDNLLQKAESIYLDILENAITYRAQFKVYYNLGIIEEKRGNSSKALTYFKKSSQEAPQYCPPHFKLGYHYSEKKDYYNALKHFKSASHGYCTSSPEPHYEQATTLLKLKKYDSARFKFQEVITRFPDSPYREMAESKIKSFQSIINQLERN